MMNFKRTYIALFAGISLGIAGCAVNRTTPVTITPPGTFPVAGDTLGIAALTWREFFDDPALEALIDTALVRNPDLLIAAQRIEMARAQVVSAKGALLPVVDAEIGTGGRKYGDYTMDGVGNYDTNFSTNIDEKRRIPSGFLPNHFVGVRSHWEVDLWGKLKSRRKAAHTRLLASESGRNLVVTGLIAEVAGEYYNLLALDSELGILRYNIELQTKANETVLALKESGRANELAVKQFASQLLNTKVLEAQIHQRIIASENRLNALLGRFPQPIERGEPLRLRSVPPAVQAGIPAQMLNRRPDIRQAQLEMLAAHADLTAADLAFLPALTLTADAGFNAFKGGLLFHPGSLAYSLLGGLTAPVLNRKGLLAEKNIRGAALQEALHSYNKLVLSSYHEVVSGLYNMQNLNQVSDLKQQEADYLREAVAASNDLYIAGYASYLEVITAQKSVMEAELDLTSIRKEQFFTLLDLYRALGGGWQ